MAQTYWVANNPSATITAAQSVILQGLGDVTATAAEINAVVDGLTATSNEINNKADGSNLYTALTTVTAVETIFATNTGRTHFKKGVHNNVGEDNPMYGKKLSEHPMWKGGRTVNPAGYVELKIETDKKHKYKLEHRIVVEEFIGRE